MVVCHFTLYLFSAIKDKVLYKSQVQFAKNRIRLDWIGRLWISTKPYYNRKIARLDNTSKSFYSLFKTVVICKVQELGCY